MARESLGRRRKPSLIPHGFQIHSQDLRQQRAAVRVRVRAVTPGVPHLVSGSRRAVLVRVRIRVLEGREHLLVREEPVAMLVREIVRAVLQEDADRLDRILAYERRIEIAARRHRLPFAAGTYPIDV